MPCEIYLSACKPSDCLPLQASRYTLLGIAPLTEPNRLMLPTGLWRWYINKFWTLSISCLLFKTQLNSIGLSVPHREHITSLLRAQPVNTVWGNSHCLLELELFLRPTVSRPVSLDIGPPFGTLDQMLDCSSSFCLTIMLFCFQCVLSDEKTGL
jgi:hypothetical protein